MAGKRTTAHGIACPAPPVLSVAIAFPCHIVAAVCLALVFVFVFETDNIEAGVKVFDKNPRGEQKKHFKCLPQNALVGGRSIMYFSVTLSLLLLRFPVIGRCSRHVLLLITNDALHTVQPIMLLVAFVCAYDTHQ